MIETLILAIGLVLLVEGLAWLLAPSLIETLLEALRNLDIDARRLVGLTAMAMGVLLVWIAHWLGA
ncbi:DUF2065 domain-containing protein [Primorskyibacter sedentarius]|uniref:DUF2065 domain-containing protein n=1 Tax=Primorskyibacter sedentarius TaxID=745311 RepID=A0A4R3J4M0_9RHOB|nr:hypothetical protein EDD52_11351 [Primorskyibacter sedentarius]